MASKGKVAARALSTLVEWLNTSAGCDRKKRRVSTKS